MQRAATLKSGQMRPTMETERKSFSRASSTTRLSLPQQGYCLRDARTRSAKAGEPSALTYVARPMRALFQGAEIVTVEAGQPAIKGLPANAKVPTGACGIPSIEEIKEHPLKPCSCRPA